MELLPQGKRVWSLDLIRGLYIFVIVLAHSIFFFHSGKNILLTGINSLADTLSFTGLLFISGATAYIAYIHERQPTTYTRNQSIKRLAVYLLGYYLLAAVGSIIMSDFSYQQLIAIILLLSLTPFTEFIIAFILFGLIHILFRPILRRLATSFFLTTITGIGLYLLGTLLSTLDIPMLPLGWKAIIVGHPGWYSFPLMQYAIVYLLGITMGYQMYTKNSKKQIYIELLSICLISLTVVGALSAASRIFSFSAQTLFQRFPPSLPFLMAGIAVVSGTMLIILHHRHLRYINWYRTFFLILGQNTFAIYLTHTLLIFLYTVLPFPQVNSALLLFVLWLLSLLSAIYFAKILPLNLRFNLTLIDWCECMTHPCSHQADYHQTQLQRTLGAFTKVSDIFSLPVGRRRIRLMHPRHIIVGLGILLFVVAPLGWAEDNHIVEEAISNSSGSVNRIWTLSTSPDYQLTYSIQLPKDIISQRKAQVQYQINELEKASMEQNEDVWQAYIETSTLPLGKHQIKTMVTIGNTIMVSKSTQFNISDPVYITWTIDWEGYDAPDNFLDAMIDVSQAYTIPMTHLFNPRIYTNPEITAERAEHLTNWVKNRRDVYNEEIGLHLHMFPDFVEAAGLEPKLEPIWGGGFSPGYDILTTNYDQTEMFQILEYAKSVFAEQGLGQPRSYRAGAWFANTDTLAALEQAEFWVDSSARTKYTFGTNKIAGPWNVSITTQPYNPSTTDQNSASPPPQFDILEVPNNGADDYAFSAAEMIKRFDQNYSGGINHKLVQVTYLTHPQWFNSTRQQNMNQVFSYINQYRLDQDRGPVVPTTLLGIYRAWTDSK